MNEELVEVRFIREMLRDARRQIQEESVNFICHALDNSYERGAGTSTLLRHKAYFRVRDWIRKQLDPYLTYEAWVRGHYPGMFIRGEYYEASSRAARLAWIDHMIEVLNEMEKEHEHQR